MALAKKSKYKTHLLKPGTSKTMCGRGGKRINTTSEVRKVSCKTCRDSYEADKGGYAAAKRKVRKVAAKAKEVISA